MQSKKKFALSILLFEILFKNFTAFKQSLFKFLIEKKYENKVRKHVAFKNGLPVVNILDLVPSLDEQLEPISFLDGTSRVIDFAFLKALAKNYPACDYLEIGTWRGESLMNMTSVCASLTAVSLSKEEMEAAKISAEQIAQDGFFVKDNPKILRIGANSQTFDFTALHNTFDLIFIDGDHSYEGVKNDTEKLFPLLKNEYSVMVWHDCGFSYEDLRYEVIAGILDGLPVQERAHVFRVSNTLCGIYTKQNVKPVLRGSETLPARVFKVNIRAEKI